MVKPIEWVSDKAITWSAMKVADSLQYTSVTPLNMEDANRLQGDIIDQLGTVKKEDGGENHKSHPCRTGVVGRGNYQVAFSASPEEFSALFPDAVVKMPAPVLAKAG